MPNQRKSCHQQDNYKMLRHPDGASDHNINMVETQSQCDIIYSDQICKTDVIESSNLKSEMQSPIQQFDITNYQNITTLSLTSSLPNHVVLPTSPRVNRLLSGQQNQSPSKSSLISRKQYKVEQQFKRNTTSTTTSGHGTTSEGETSSIVKKISSSSSPGNRSYREAIQRQPASSGYESTIVDDESDRELVNQRYKQTVLVHDKQITQVKVRKKKNKKNNDKEKRESIEGCSSFCCKFMGFYNSN